MGVVGELVGAGADHSLVGDGKVAVEDTEDFLAVVGGVVAAHSRIKRLAVQIIGKRQAGGFEEGGQAFVEVDEIGVGTAGILTFGMGDDERDALTSQLDSFLASVRDGTPPVVDGPAGRNAIAAAERVVNAIQQHSWEGLRKSRL